MLSALDNRPLNFQEFEKYLSKTVFVSATPGDYERSKGEALVEQIIRPTGLLDPKISVRSTKNQVKNLLKEITKRIKRKERVLVTTLTKKSAEQLSSHFQNAHIRTKYLHSDIKTLERTEILRDLRSGVIDVLVGINLLREGLDLPEVSLVAVLDSDREGFLRSERSLIQIIGRAARHLRGEVILYADQITKSMKRAMDETERRRKIQDAHNKKWGIKPKSVKKSLKKGLAEIYGLDSTEKELEDLSPIQIKKKIKQLKKQMREAAREMNFEEASQLRDRIKRLEIKELESL